MNATSARFKLNTALRSWGRVKGWNCTCDLWNTLKHVQPEQKPALIAAITAELAKGQTNLDAATVEIRSPFAKRGTRSGKRIGSRYDRAWHKVNELRKALAELGAPVA